MLVENEVGKGDKEEEPEQQEEFYPSPSWASESASSGLADVEVVDSVSRPCVVSLCPSAGVIWQNG